MMMTIDDDDDDDDDDDIYLSINLFIYFLHCFWKHFSFKSAYA